MTCELAANLRAGAGARATDWHDDLGSLPALLGSLYGRCALAANLVALPAVGESPRLDHLAAGGRVGPVLMTFFWLRERMPTDRWNDGKGKQES